MEPLPERSAASAVVSSAPWIDSAVPSSKPPLASSKHSWYHRPAPLSPAQLPPPSARGVPIERAATSSSPACSAAAAPSRTLIAGCLMAGQRLSITSAT
eukprot:scaffold65977_cov75-Phaeocystis_antarctica.AAC.1